MPKLDAPLLFLLATHTPTVVGRARGNGGGVSGLGTGMGVVEEQGW